MGSTVKHFRIRGIENAHYNDNDAQKLSMYIVTISGIVEGVYQIYNVWKAYSNVVKSITLYQSVTLELLHLFREKYAVHESSRLCPNILSHVGGRGRERERERERENILGCDYYIQYLQMLMTCLYLMGLTNQLGMRIDMLY